VNIGIYNGVTAANASERRLEAITANLANVDTPAYKRIATGTRAFSIPGARQGEHQLVTSTQTDFSQGTLKTSASPYHLALMGSGFFALEGPNGELHTRNGQFHVDDAGVLQSAEGYPVSWEQTPTPIDPTGEVVTIDGSGLVRQGSAELGRIKFVDFEDPSTLTSVGGGYFMASQASVEKPSDASLYQNHLEDSNVASIDELVGMISLQRSFENARTVMTLLDQSYARLTQIR